MLPVVLVYGVLSGAFDALRAPSIIASQPSVKVGTVVVSPGLMHIVQVATVAEGILGAMVLWIVASSVMYVVARLSGGQAGFNKSTAVAGLAMSPLLISSGLVLLLSYASPSLSLTQSQGLGMALLLNAPFVFWSGLLDGFGTSIAFRVGLRRTLFVALLFNLLYFYGSYLLILQKIAIS